MRTPKTASQCINELRAMASETNRTGMERYGIATGAALGVSMPDIREVARKTVKNHELAQELWSSGIHEARILASLVEQPEAVTREQMETWARDFNSWDLCDQVTGNLFDRLPNADNAIRAWYRAEEEFIRRAAFAMIAWRSVHLKNEPDEAFEAYFPFIEHAATDERNFVKKAVNWALRQIGKRNLRLHRQALELATKLAGSPDPASRWIGANAVRELGSEKVLARLQEKGR